jgi:hypothetical protein
LHENEKRFGLLLAFQVERWWEERADRSPSIASRTVHQIAFFYLVFYNEICGSSRYFFARLFTTICS